VAHLLAELIENATVFSPADTVVQVSGYEQNGGGVLMEIIDKGIGIPEDRLAEMNWRLQTTPVIDVSVSRHIGLLPGQLGLVRAITDDEPRRGAPEDTGGGLVNAGQQPMNW
jgi:K+-sensing histidine kinase KdpD